MRAHARAMRQFCLLGDNPRYRAEEAAARWLNPPGCFQRFRSRFLNSGRSNSGPGGDEALYRERQKRFRLRRVVSRHFIRQRWRRLHRRIGTQCICRRVINFGVTAKSTGYQHIGLGRQPQEISKTARKRNCTGHGGFSTAFCAVKIRCQPIFDIGHNDNRPERCFISLIDGQRSLRAQERIRSKRLFCNCTAPSFDPIWSS